MKGEKMTLCIQHPVIGRTIPKIKVMTNLDEIIRWAIQARREAHGDDERQAELNSILSQAYAEKWGQPLRKEEKKMKKTHKMAVIGQLNRMTGNYTHIERRVFEDEAGNKYVRINGDYTDIDWLVMNGRTVHLYF